LSDNIHLASNPSDTNLPTHAAKAKKNTESCSNNSPLAPKHGHDSRTFPASHRNSRHASTASNDTPARPPERPEGSFRAPWGGGMSHPPQGTIQRGACAVIGQSARPGRAHRSLSERIRPCTAHGHVRRSILQPLARPHGTPHGARSAPLWRGRGGQPKGGGSSAAGNRLGRLTGSNRPILSAWSASDRKRAARPVRWPPAFRRGRVWAAPRRLNLTAVRPFLVDHAISRQLPADDLRSTI
jgi:hypothetical protein